MGRATLPSWQCSAIASLIVLNGNTCCLAQAQSIDAIGSPTGSSGSDSNPSTADESAFYLAAVVAFLAAVGAAVYFQKRRAASGKSNKECAAASVPALQASTI